MPKCPICASEGNILMKNSMIIILSILYDRIAIRTRRALDEAKREPSLKEIKVISNIINERS